ncbi:MAG TPA: universal stress protein [Kofleriaceae bacterium]|nr:universal stress protein [Kofleriaceae bacterium]
MSTKKILCPVDFSAGSQRAMQVAVRLAGDMDAELVLVHAWYVPASVYPSEEPLLPQLVQSVSDEAARGLDDAVREATALGARRVTWKLLHGVPWRAIVDALDEPAFELAVIGTHGRTGLSRFLLGSVAEKVVRHAPCSVLAVRTEGEVGSFTHALVPVDFSDGARHAIDRAAELVRPGGAGITLLHIIEAPVSYSGELPDPELLRELDRRGAESLERTATELRSRVTVPVTARSRVGWPGAEILAALDHDPTIDLIVMGSHGRTGIKRVLLGSVAEKVVRHARCPVLVARQRE